MKNSQHHQHQHSHYYNTMTMASSSSRPQAHRMAANNNAGGGPASSSTITLWAFRVLEPFDAELVEDDRMWSGASEPLSMVRMHLLGDKVSNLYIYNIVRV